MKITEQHQGAVTVLKPEGPLIDADADKFKATAINVARQTLGRVVIDMSAIPFVDSKGLESLLDVTDALGQSGHTLKICAISKTVREVLELTELVSSFEHFVDVNSAVRSFL